MNKKDLEVKPSNISGKGLFTKIAIKKNTTILEYTGKTLPCNTTVKSHFLFEVKKGRKCLHVIYGSRCIGRYVNYANCKKIQNAKFVQLNSRIYLKATKNIPKNKEILSWYGKNTYNV